MATWNITITIPDDSAQQQRILNKFCSKHGYDASTGLTKMQFVKKVIAKFIKNSLLAEEMPSAIDQAKADKIAEIEELNIN